MNVDFLLENWGTVAWGGVVFLLGILAANLNVIKEVFLWVSGILEAKNLLIISNTSVVDPFFEFYEGHHTSVNECIFTIKNVSGRSLKFDGFKLNHKNSEKPYVIISSPNEGKKGLVHVENEESFTRTYPDQHIDGSDFNMSYVILGDSDTLVITVEDRGFPGDYVGDLNMKQHRDSDSIAGKKSRSVKLSLYTG